MRSPRRPAARSRPTREPYDRVLIVCEGTKTEPRYFSEVIRHYRLSTANVEIVGIGTGPLTIIEKAKEAQRNERKNREKYDRIYCVFDRDQHANFQRASDLAKTNGLRLCRSWPCFEFWFLLHFCFTRRPYEQAHGTSSAENCIRDLRQYWPDYEKALVGSFNYLRCRVEDARRHAVRAQEDARNTGEYNPSTEVHDLVTYLENIRENK